MAKHELYADTGASAIVLQTTVNGDPVAVPVSNLIFTADFQRSGNDLVVTGKDGQVVIVEDYFATEQPPHLQSPEGAYVFSDVVKSLAGPLAPGQYAQAGAPDGKEPIGQVETLEGTATATRTDGTKVVLKVGDPVFEGDVVETGADSKLGITFIDQTVFSLSEDARMVLDELVYDPGGSDNSMLVNLVQGSFVFIAGQVAPTGDMKVQTPVATMGIRGTTVIANVGSDNGTSALSLAYDPNGEKGWFQFFDPISKALLGAVKAVGEKWVIKPTGNPGETPEVVTYTKSSEELANDQAALAFAFRTFSAAQERIAAANNESSATDATPGSGLGTNTDPTAPADLDSGGGGTGGGGGEAEGGEEEESEEEEEAAQPTNTPPTADAFQADIGTDGFFQGTNEDTDTGFAFEPGKVFAFRDVDPGDALSLVTITELPDEGSGRLLLPGDPDPIPVTEGQGIPVGQIGDLFYSPDGDFETLSTGQVAFVTFKYTVSDQLGASSGEATATIIIDGVNDIPIAFPDFGSGNENQVVTVDVLANDTDIDSLDNITNFSLDTVTVTAVSTTGNTAFSQTAAQVDAAGVATIVTSGFASGTQHALEFNPGTVFDELDVGDVATVVVTYEMSDDEGAKSTSTATFTVTGVNDAPVISFIGTNNQGTVIEDGLAADDVTQIGDPVAMGQLIASDVDADDNTGNDDWSVVAQAGQTASVGGQEVTGTFGTLVIDEDGKWTYTLDNTTGGAADQLNEGDAATDIFVVRNTDKQGDSDTETITISVNGSGGVAGSNDAPVIGDPGGEEIGTVFEAGVDTDGTTPVGNPTAMGTLTVSDVDSNDNTTNDTWSIVAQAGQTQTATDTVTTALGQITVDQDGKWTYTLDDTSGGAADQLDSTDAPVESFIIRVADQNGAIDEQQVDVTVDGSNDLPVAVNDPGNPATGDTDEDNSVTVDVLANDTDVDGDDDPSNFTLNSVTVTGVTGLTGVTVGDLNTANVATVDSNQLKFDPKTFFHQLDSNDTSTVTISYEMQDDEGAKSTATATITVNGVNDAPVAADDPGAPATGDTDEDNSVTVDVLANDTDVDGDDDPSNFTLNSVNITGVTGLTGVTVGDLNTANVATVDSNQLKFDPKTFFHQLDSNDTSTVTISYEMQDDEGLTSTATATITVNGVNDAPVAADDPGTPAAGDTDEDNSVTVDVLANDTDVDGDDDPSNFTLNSVNITGATNLIGVTAGDLNTANVATVDSNQLKFDPKTFFHQLGSTETSTVTIDYQMQDDEGLTSTATATITVNGVNDNPVNSAPTTTQAVNEDTALVFSAANSNAITVSDVDIRANDLTVELTVGNGTLTAGGSPAQQLLLTSISGDGSDTLELVGSASAINDVLEGLTYQGTQDYNGGDTLQVSTTDEATGNDTDTIAITVNPVNDAPEISIATSNLISNGDFEAVDTGGDLTRINIGDLNWGSVNWDVTWTNTSIDAGVTDLSTAQFPTSMGLSPDNQVGYANFHASLKQTIGVLQPNAVYEVSFDVYTRSDVTGPAFFEVALLVDGTRVPALAQTDTGPAKESGQPYTKTFDLSSVDLTSFTPGSSVVEVSFLNTFGSAGQLNIDNVSVTTTSLTTNEDVPLTLSGIQISDVDVSETTGAELTLTLQVTSGTVNVVNNGSGFATVGNDGTTAVTITGSLADINATLAAANNITYQGNLNFNGTDQLSITVDDQGNTGSAGALQDVETINITVNPVNDAPILDVSAVGVQAAQFAGNVTDFTIVNPASNIPTGDFAVSFFVNDPVLDNTQIGNGEAYISYATSSSENEFAIHNNVNGLLVFIGGTNLNTGVTIPQDGALHSVIVNYDSTAGTVEVFLDGVSQGVTSGAPTGGITAGGALVLGQDQDSLGGGFEVDQALNGQLADIGFYSSQLPASDIDTIVQGGNVSSPAILLEWNATTGAFEDVSGNGNTMTTNGSVTSATAREIVAAEDTAVAVDGIQISDVDVNETTGAELVVTLTVAQGTLAVTAGLANGLQIAQIVGTNGDKTITLTGSLAEINTTLGTAGAVTYQGAVNFNGSDQLSVNVNDQGNTGGGALSDAATIDITVNPIADAPQGTDKTITIDEDISHTFSAADFGFSDPNDAPAPDALTGVKITTLPTDGTLILGSSAVTAGQIVTVAQLTANQLVFTPDADENGTGYATLTFQVQDDNANPGETEDQSANTITFDVTPVNDAPVVNPALAGAATEDAPALVALNPFSNTSDVDGDTLAITNIQSTLPAGVTYGGGIGAGNTDANFVLTNQNNISLANIQVETGGDTTANPDLTDGTEGTMISYTATGAFWDGTVAGQGADYHVGNLNDGDVGSGNTSDGLYAIANDNGTPITLDFGGTTTVGSIAIHHGYNDRDNGSYTLKDGANNILGSWTVTGGLGFTNDSAHSFWLTLNQPINTDKLVLEYTSSEIVAVGEVSFREIQVFGPQFFLDPADAAFQSLAQGATTPVSVTYDVSDGTTTTPTTATWTVTGVNDAPTLTSFSSTIDTVNEDTQVELTFAELNAQGDEADVDGTVDAYVVKAVSSGTLLIGASSGTAAAFAVGTNDTIDATNKAYWTPAQDANGTLNAFTAVAQDNNGVESATPVQAQVTVNAVNDVPTLTAFAAAIDTTDENTQVELTFAELNAQGDEADVDGTVDAYVVKAVSSGTLLIGTSSGTATAFAVGTNDTIDAANKAYWTPPASTSGTLNAFTAVAQDNNGAESAAPIQAQVTVTAAAAGPTTGFAPVGSAIHVDDVAGGSSSDPAIASLSTGGFVITYTSNGNIRAQTFDAAGAEISTEFQVNTTGGPLINTPSIAALASGTTTDSGNAVDFVVTYSSGATQGTDQDIFYKLANNAVSYFSLEGQASDSFTDAGSGLSGQVSSVSTGLTGGGFAVAYMSFGQDGDGWGIFTRAFSATGAPLGAAASQVNSFAAGTQLDPAITALAGGGYGIAWRSSTTQVRYKEHDSNGNVAAAEIVVDAPAGTMGGDGISISELTNGHLVAVWQNGQDARASIFTNNGTSVKADFLVSTTTTPIGGSEPSAAALADGGFYVVWTAADAAGTGVYGQQFDASGTTVGSTTLINETTTGSEHLDRASTGLGPGGEVVTQLANGDIVVTYTDGSDVFARILKTNEAPVAVADTNSGDAVSEAGISASTSLVHTFDDPTPTSSGSAGDRFGTAVAVSGNQILVGADSDDTAGTSNVGQAHLYDATTGALIRTFDQPSPTGGDSRFGISVSLDGNNALIGAYAHDLLGAGDAGQAYLFDTATGNLLQTFTDPTIAGSDQFGFSVAINGDNVLIGSRFDDANGTDVGAAYLYSASTGALTQTFIDPTPGTSDYFGNSVAVDGNFVLIGAELDDTAGTNVGQAFLFNATTGALLQTFNDPTVTAFDQFGLSVAVDGNFVLIGAPGDDTSGLDAGQAFLFNATTGALLQTFNNPTPASGDFFGSSVSVDGNNVLIGASFDDSAGSNVGQAYLFDATTGNLLETFNDPTATTTDQFGFSVDLDGSNVVVGAYQDDTTATNVGQAHLFTLGGSATAGDPTATGNVLTNDTDADSGDTKTVVGVAAGDVSGSEQSGNVATNVTGTFGTLNITSTGAYTYTLDNNDTDTQALTAGQAAQDVFTYTMEDAAGAKSTTTVTIDITGRNDAPIAFGELVVTDEDTVLNGNIFADNGSGADADPEGDGFALNTLTTASGSPLLIGSENTLASGAKLTVQANGDFTFDPRGAFDFVPQGGGSAENFKYTVIDTNGAVSNEVLVNLSVSGINDAPVVSAVTSPVTFTEGDVGAPNVETVDLATLFTASDADLGETPAIDSSSITITPDGSSDADITVPFSISGSEISFDRNVFDFLDFNETAVYNVNFDLVSGPDTVPLSTQIVINGATDVPALFLIQGTSGGETLDGTAGNDAIFGNGGNDQLNGLAGNDFLFGSNDGGEVFDGGDGDDSIFTGDNNPNLGDLTYGSIGNDRISFSGNAVGYQALSYGMLAAAITFTLDVSANTAMTVKGAGGVDGTDTIIDVIKPLDAGWAGTGGLGVYGTTGADTFVLNTQPDMWMQVGGGDGVDTFTINGTGAAVLDFRFGDLVNGPTQGVNVNLNTKTISDDGFNNADVLNGTGEVFEVRGTDHDDILVGSGANDRFIGRAGNDSIDGLGGFDLVRYDRGGVTQVNVEYNGVGSATVTGIWNGEQFTHTLTSIEQIRGARIGITEFGGDIGDDNFVARGGVNAFSGGSGDDSFTAAGNANLFSFSPGSENDTIHNFVVGRDLIELEDYGFTGVGDIHSIAFIGGNTVIDLDGTSPGTHTITVVGVDLTGVPASDLFIFADIQGTPFDDPALNGTAANETIAGFAGNDVIMGNGGHDILESGGAVLDPNGLDDLSGGAGNDILVAEGGATNLRGGEGNDVLFATQEFSGSGDFDWVQARYDDSPAGIVANLTTGSPTSGGVNPANVPGSMQINDGHGTTDTVVGAHVVVDSDFDDFVYVDGNYINSYGNFIEVRLSEGDDFVDLSAMTGRARVSWKNALDGVDANLGTGTATDNDLGNGDQIGTDTFVGANALRGSDFDDTLTGDANGNQLRGGGANDMLVGAGGSDDLRGESGNDVLSVNDNAFSKVDGGSDQDTLVWDSTADIDFSGIDNMKIDGIEAINAANGNAQTLTLDLQSILDFSSSVNDLVTAGTGAVRDNSLLIDADAADTIHLAQDGSGTWAEDAGLAFGIYDVYTFTETAGSTVLTTLAIDEDATVVPNFT